MAEEKGSPQKKTPDEAAASAEAVIQQLATMGIVAGNENGAAGGAKESQPRAGQGLTAGQVGIVEDHERRPCVMCAKEIFHSRHIYTHTAGHDAAR
jgi:predicted deacylase